MLFHAKTFFRPSCALDWLQTTLEFYQSFSTPRLLRRFTPRKDSCKSRLPNLLLVPEFFDHREKSIEGSGIMADAKTYRVTRMISSKDVCPRRTYSLAA